MGLNYGDTMGEYKRKLGDMFEVDEKPSLVSYIEDDTEEGLVSLVEGDARDEGRFIEEDDSPKVLAMIKDYQRGVSDVRLEEMYEMSSGQIRSHLYRHNVPMKKSTNSSVQKRIAHLKEADIQNVIKDYLAGLGANNIYKKYDLYKNGLYYILDSNRVPRKHSVSTRRK